MGALDSINRVARVAVERYGETAQHTDSSGTETEIQAIRLESLVNASPGGQQFEDEGPYILVTTDTPIERGDWIQFGTESPRQVVARERHGLRGYMKITLTEI